MESSDCLNVVSKYTSNSVQKNLNWTLTIIPLSGRESNFSKIRAYNLNHQPFKIYGRQDQTPINVFCGFNFFCLSNPNN